MGDKAISQRKRLAMGKKAPQGKAPVKMRGGGMVKKTGVKRMRGGGMVKKTGVKRMRGGGMVKKTGVKRFSGGGSVNLGRGSSEFAGTSTSHQRHPTTPSGSPLDLAVAGLVGYGLYNYGKKKGEEKGKKNKGKKD